MCRRSGGNEVTLLPEIFKTQHEYLDQKKWPVSKKKINKIVKLKLCVCIARIHLYLSGGDK